MEHINAPLQGGRYAKHLSFVAGSVFLISAIFAAYLPAIHGGPIWDDDYMLMFNPVFKEPHALWRTFFDLQANRVYYPLTLSALFIEFKLFGLQNLTGYHIVNILLHSTNAILCWRLLTQLQVRGAFVIAAVWALHPINAETVSWITEHKNTLSGLFYLGTMYALLRYYQVIKPEKSPRGRWYALALIGFAAALGAKSTAVTLPAAALLLVWWKNGRIGITQILAIIPFLMIAAASGALTQYVETHITAGWDPAWGISPLQKILVAGRALCFYTSKLIWPARLSFAYPRWIANPQIIWQWFFPIAVIAVLTGLWLARRRIGRGPITGLLFFCGTLTPALSFFHVLFQRYSFVADHFQYLAGLGMVAVVVGSTASIGMPRKIELSVSATIILTLWILTFQSAHRFVNDETAWGSALEVDAGNPIANLNYGTDLKNRRVYDEAVIHILRAASSPMLAPNVSMMMGEIYEANRNYPMALQCYERAAQLASPEPLPHLQYGSMLLVTGQLSAAAEQLQTAIDLNPKLAEAYDNLGVCLLHMGQPQQARHQFEIALSLEPTLPLVRKHLAEANQMQQDGNSGGSKR